MQDGSTITAEKVLAAPGIRCFANLPAWHDEVPAAQRAHTCDLVFASGYRADIAAVPYLAPVLDHVQVTEGFPDLSEGFETSLPGLFVTGFAATKDFGPFYGFTRGCPSSATLAVAEMLR